MYAALEVAVARQHGGCHQIPSVDGSVDTIQKITRIADAGCATVPVTVVLQWCYSGVTVVLQWCYSGVTVVLQ
jgi:hypothetical protein